jgi:hypothetical protein
MMRRLRERKHLVLLTALVLTVAAQPLAAVPGPGLVVYDVLTTLALLAIFVIIFERQWERVVASVVLAPGVVSNWAGYGLSAEAQVVSYAAFHCLMVAFLGFTVAVIVRGLFRGRAVRLDGVLGAACGYLLSGVVWGNLYLLAYTIDPNSFKVNPEIKWQLGNEYTRRALFNYFSFSALATLGYGDLTPVYPATCMLAWSEAIFGQFYLAVVVAQLVAMHLAHRERKEANGSMQGGDGESP